MNSEQAKIVLEALKDPTKVVCIRLKKKWYNFLSCDIEQIKLDKIAPENIRVHVFARGEDGGFLFCRPQDQPDPKSYIDKWLS